MCAQGCLEATSSLYDSAQMSACAKGHADLGHYSAGLSLAIRQGQKYHAVVSSCAEPHAFSRLGAQLACPPECVFALDAWKRSTCFDESHITHGMRARCHAALPWLSANPPSPPTPAPPPEPAAALVSAAIEGVVAPSFLVGCKVTLGSLSAAGQWLMPTGASRALATVQTSARGRYAFSASALRALRIQGMRWGSQIVALQAPRGSSCKTVDGRAFRGMLLTSPGAKVMSPLTSIGTLLMQEPSIGGKRAALRLLTRALRLDNATQLMDVDPTYGALEGSPGARAAVLASYKVLALLQQTAAVLTVAKAAAAKGVTAETAYLVAYAALADAVQARAALSSTAELPKGTRRGLQTAAVAVNLLEDPAVLQAVVQSAAVRAQVTVDITIIAMAATVTVAIVQAYDAAATMGSTAADQGDTSSQWLQSVVKISVIDDSLAARSMAIAEGVANGTLTIETAQRMGLAMSSTGDILAQAERVEVEGPNYQALLCASTDSNSSAQALHSTLCQSNVNQPTSQVMSDIELDIGLCAAFVFVCIALCAIVYMIRRNNASHDSGKQRRGSEYGRARIASVNHASKQVVVPDTALAGQPAAAPKSAKVTGRTSLLKAADLGSNSEQVENGEGQLAVTPKSTPKSEKVTGITSLLKGEYLESTLEQDSQPVTEDADAANKAASI
jgi:hypothetical protein